MGRKARKNDHFVDGSAGSDAPHVVLESCNYGGDESIILEGTDGIVDTWNSGGDGSNSLILPGKKMDKLKEKNKASERSKKKVAPLLSKNKQRKLKQLEEEKKKKLLQSKSIEILEKCKISDSAYSILYSSGTIGRAETFKERRYRAVQLSKAGLEVPEDILPFKKKDSMVSDKNEIASESDADQNFSFVAHGDSVILPEEPKEHVDNYDHSMVCNLNATSNEDVPSTGNVVSLSEEDLKMGMDACMSTDNNNSSNLHNLDLKDEVPCRPDENDQQKNSTNFEVQGIVKPTVVYVSRPVEIEEQRKELPIIMMEQEIMEAINENSKIILCGETGCGKTTQVPQFLYEAGFGSSSHSDRKGIIGVTQPRRVAVLATAKRVSFELGLQLGKEVGFQVRHDKYIGKNCSIKFMTDGILLREVQSDFLLKRYSVIILDEAHERSLNTDILIGMLSRIIKLREEMYREQQKKISTGIIISPENMITQLKLVLMSATLRVEDFISNRKLFDPSPPVIEVPVRQYPVTIHFSKRTHDDYLGQAYKKVVSIHKRLPPGGILVFVTGQREVEFLSKKLHKFAQELTKINSANRAVNELTGNSELNMKDIDEAFEIENDIYDPQTDGFNNFEDDFDNSVISSDLSDSETESDLHYESEEEDQVTTGAPENTGSVLNLLGDAGNLSSLKAAFDALAGSSSDPIKNKEPNDSPSSSYEKEAEHTPSAATSLYVLPLYAMLPASAQLRVFEEVPEGKRLVAVATNVAETSITIPGIKYVVDTGKEKVKNYNHKNGIATYEVSWISKASAAQRAGRAGRTGPGHCYRLYSSAAFSKNEIFPDFSCPEISKVPVDGVVLLMKFLNIHKVMNFPFPTPPASEALMEAEHCLKALEALDFQGRLTPLGRSMAQYPMSPRHSRMLLTLIKIMKNQKCYKRANIVLGYAIAAAAVLSFPNPFLLQFGDNNETSSSADQEQFASNEIKDQQEKQRQKKAKEKVKEARARFSNPSSDALTAAYALQLFEQSSNTSTFCRENSLHLKTMEDMSKLRKQLLHLIFYHSKFCEEYSWNHGTSEDVEFCWRIHSDKHPLLMNEEELIGQSICAGWVDRVAKRVRMIKYSSDNAMKNRSVSYQSCALEDAVFVHRWSSVSRSTPEFVVYSELLHTKRPYMHGVTSVKPEWLVKYASSICTFSAPLTDPKPFYEPLKDQIFCWVTPSFGRHNWQLPLHNLPIKNDISRLSVFASSLLEGHVLPCLRSVQKFLAMPPSIILRPEALGQRRVGDLLSRLKVGAKTIDSRSMLRDIWNENPHFLHSEIQQWFQEKFQNQLEKIWEQMHYEAQLEGHELFPKRAKQEGKVKKR